MSKIEMSRRYSTRDGREVRIYATDGCQDYPIHGAVNSLSGWDGFAWTSDGHVSLNHIDDCDLIEVPREITVNAFVNITIHGTPAFFRDLEDSKFAGSFHQDKIVAFPFSVTIPENWRGEK